MLNTSDVNELSRRRVWILFPAMAAGILSLCGYFGVVILFRDPIINWIQLRFGSAVAEFAPAVLILPSIAFLLTPVVLAERKSKQFALVCPNCNTDVTSNTMRILATRCCSTCGIQIVAEGRCRDPKVFNRYSNMKQRRVLVYLFWAWPVLGALILLQHSFDSTAFANCIQMLFIPGLLGTVTTGWAFARTIDRRYLPQLVTSVLILSIGAARLWYVHL